MSKLMPHDDGYLEQRELARAVIRDFIRTEFRQHLIMKYAHSQPEFSENHYELWCVVELARAVEVHKLTWFELDNSDCFDVRTNGRVELKIHRGDVLACIHRMTIGRDLAKCLLPKLLRFQSPLESLAQASE